MNSQTLLRFGTLALVFGLIMGQTASAQAPDFTLSFDSLPNGIDANGKPLTGGTPLYNRGFETGVGNNAQGTQADRFGNIDTNGDNRGLDSNGNAVANPTNIGRHSVNTVVKQIEANGIKGTAVQSVFTVDKNSNSTSNPEFTIYSGDGSSWSTDSTTSSFLTSYTAFNAGGFYGGTPGVSGDGTYLGELWSSVGIQIGSTSGSCPIVLLDSHDALEVMAEGDFTDESVYPETVVAGGNPANGGGSPGSAVVSAGNDTVSQGGGDTDMLTGDHASLNNTIDSTVGGTNSNPDIWKTGSNVGDEIPKDVPSNGLEAMGNVLVFESGGGNRLGDGLVNDDTHVGAWIFDIDESIATTAKLESLWYVDDIVDDNNDGAGLELDVFFRDGTASRYLINPAKGENIITEIQLTTADMAKNVDYFLLQNDGQSGGIGRLEFADYVVIPELSTISLAFIFCSALGLIKLQRRRRT